MVPPWPESPASEAPQEAEIETQLKLVHLRFIRISLVINLLCLTSFKRSSLPPTWTQLKKIWGMVLHPVSSFSFSLSSEWLPTSTSCTAMPKRPREALASTQCGQPWIEYSVTRPGALLSDSPICSKKKVSLTSCILSIWLQLNSHCTHINSTFSMTHISRIKLL